MQNSSRITHKTFSCIIPAYNEGSRISAMLRAILGCKYLDEIIIVDDGSTDNTWEVISAVRDPRIQTVQLRENQGKLHAFFAGIHHATGTHIVMVDADYTGFGSHILSEMIEPVRQGQYDATGMRWGNGFFLTKILKIDILTGTRVLPRSVFHDEARYMQSSGFALEVKINEILYEQQIRMLFLYYPEVKNPTKPFQLFWKEPRDILRAMSFWKILKHTWYLYKQQP